MRCRLLAPCDGYCSARNFHRSVQQRTCRGKSIPTFLTQVRHRWKHLDTAYLEEHCEDGGGEKLHEFHSEANLFNVLSASAILLNAIVVVAAGPTTSVQSEYLMTLYVPIAEAREIDE